MASQLSALEDRPVPSKRHFPKLVEGMIQIYAAPHRHFFVHVMAQALQQAGQGTSVLIVQFLKGGINQGPNNPVHLGQNLTWLRCDISRCITTSTIEEHERVALLALWNHVQKVVLDGHYSLVILDELSLAVHWQLIPLPDVLRFLKHRPSHVDVAISGPEIPAAIMDMADQVTELRRSYRE
ncbi:MAG: cob(I)yrinic acid a,c-diamide adenosyltransferase [Leptolyngbyaceae bacterium]|nr:cob(I)yrinic acid a,c-diamide adenosyltransferase [Leptolyngbyaceae bacterium]